MREHEEDAAAAQQFEAEVQKKQVRSSGLSKVTATCADLPLKHWPAHRSEAHGLTLSATRQRQDEVCDSLVFSDAEVAQAATQGYHCWKCHVCWTCVGIRVFIHNSR